MGHASAGWTGCSSVRAWIVLCMESIVIAVAVAVVVGGGGGGG